MRDLHILFVEPFEELGLGIAYGVPYPLEQLAALLGEARLRGPAVPGGVITSAGIVLAATFAVLAALPVVGIAELGFTVAVGILLDTFVVRSVLVPALALDVGRHLWWPLR